MKENLIDMQYFNTAMNSEEGKKINAMIIERAREITIALINGKCPETRKEIFKIFQQNGIEAAKSYIIKQAIATLYGVEKTKKLTPNS